MLDYGRKGAILNYQQPWAVVLAGGDGIRLQALTQLISGEDRPKQYYPLYGGETLLARTRSRLACGFHPERTLFAVVKPHENFYRYHLADVKPSCMVIQPTNKGTTPAVICSLLRITTLAGDPVVAFFPTDHHYADESRFIASVHRAVRVAQRRADTLVILGADPECAEVDYGWIEPGPSLGGRFINTLFRVRRFWEKPPHATAQALLDAGCLWNTFVMVGRASIFLEMIENTVAPGVSRALVEARRRAVDATNSAGLDQLWATLDAGDFSRDVLTASTQNLAVLRIGDAGWSDLGTPDRLQAVMSRLAVTGKKPCGALIG